MMIRVKKMEMNNCVVDEISKKRIGQICEKKEGKEEKRGTGSKYSRYNLH
jgi:hypothetical protein